MSGAGRLWVVATPIGHLDDVTLRALRVLREADLIVAEDTRHTRGLLTHHGIGARLRAFHAHTGDDEVRRLVDELCSGVRLALVSDAGTPVVSDPGIRLVAAAREAGVPVETIPGASAVTAALAVAGLRCDGFRFVGFLPRAGARRKRVLDDVAREPAATVLFESPRRLGRTLGELAKRLGDRRRGAVCRELTKVHEEVVRGTLAELARTFPEGTRGEVTVVLEGGDTPWALPGDPTSPEELVDDDTVRTWLAEGTSVKDAAARLAAATGEPKRTAYRRVLALADR